MKNAVLINISNKELAEVIALCRGNRNALERIKKEFDRATKRVWRMNNVERWLHPEPAKRGHPSFGAGLLLVQCGKSVIEEMRREEIA